jgi:hypothetical protein
VRSYQCIEAKLVKVIVPQDEAYRVYFANACNAKKAFKSGLKGSFSGLFIDPP